MRPAGKLVPNRRFLWRGEGEMPHHHQVPCPFTPLPGFIHDYTPLAAPTNLRMHQPDIPNICGRLRSLVQDSLGKQLHRSAAFYAEKLVAMSGNLAVDVYLLSQAYFQGRQYRRALDLLSKASYIELDVRFRYLAARCLAEVEEWDPCLQLIGDSDLSEPLAVQQLRASEGPGAMGRQGPSGTEVGLYSCICLLRGQVFSAQENMPLATKWFERALESDPYNYEAFEALTSAHMLTCQDEAKLVTRMHVPPQDRWLELVYRVSCKKYDRMEQVEAYLDELEGRGREDAHTHVHGPVHDADMQPDTPSTPTTPIHLSRQDPASSSSPSPGYGLSASMDVVSCRADLLYHRAMTSECYALCQQILQADPHHPRALALYLASANELGKKEDLFVLAHRLVEEEPDAALSWYAVGVYYLCTRQYEQARKYLYKATSLEPRFSPAWIAFGNAFAALDEADQAMSAYRTAARLFPGLHLPLVGIGMEHLRTSNLVLADQTLRLASQLCPTDATVLNELGVIAYRNGDYYTAAQTLAETLRHVPTVNRAWETTIVNYGHALRKLKRYEEARVQYTRALSLQPMNASVLVSLAYTLHLEGKLDEAIEEYHRALALRPDDIFAIDMLGMALEEHGRTARVE